MTDKIKSNNNYLNQIELLAKNPNNHFIVEGQGENATIKKASLITTAIETFRGWIGLGNRTSKDIIEYQLIQTIGNGTAKGLITLTNLASILKAAKAAGLTSTLDEKTGKHAELTSTIQSIVTGKFDLKTYATNAERFYSSHKSLSKIAAKPIIPQIAEQHVIKSPVEQPPEPKKSPTPAAQVTITVATAVLNEIPLLPPLPSQQQTPEPLLDDHEVTDLTSITYPQPEPEVEQPVNELVSKKSKGELIEDNPARKKKEKNASIAVKTGLLAAVAFVIINVLSARFSPTTSVISTQTQPEETFNHNITGIYDFRQSNFTPVANNENYNLFPSQPIFSQENSAMVDVVNVSTQVSKSCGNVFSDMKTVSDQDIIFASEVQSPSPDLEEKDEFELSTQKPEVKKEAEVSAKVYTYQQFDLNLKSLDIKNYDPETVPLATKDAPMLPQLRFRANNLGNGDAYKIYESHLRFPIATTEDCISSILNKGTIQINDQEVPLKQHIADIFEQNGIIKGNEPLVWSAAVENRFKEFFSANNVPQFITQKPGLMGSLIGEKSKLIENPLVTTLLEEVKGLIGTFNFVLDQNIKNAEFRHPKACTIANIRSVPLDNALILKGSNYLRLILRFLIQEGMLVGGEYATTFGDGWKTNIYILGGNKREG